MKKFNLFLFAFLLFGLISCEDYSEPNRKYIQRISNESDFNIVIHIFDIQTDIQRLEIPIQSKSSYEKDSTLKTGGDT